MAVVTTTTARNDSAVARGIRTFLQAIIGLIVGILLIPGVQQYVTDSLTHTLGAVIAPSFIIGLVSLIWNILRRDVPNV